MLDPRAFCRDSSLMINFQTENPSAWSLSPAELVDAIRWRKSRGKDGAAAAAEGSVPFFRWLATDDALPNWKTKTPVADPLWQVLWSRNAFEQTGRSKTLASVVEMFVTGKSKRERDKMLRMLFNEFDAQKPPTPFELIALLTILQTRRAELKDETLQRLFTLCVVASQELSLQIDTTPPGMETADQHLLRRGELPLMISRVFEAIQGASHLRKQGRETLIRLIDEETDTDGTPHGRILGRLPLFVAGFTRTLSCHGSSDSSLLSNTATKRYAQLVRQAALLADRDGRTPLASAEVFSPASLLHSSVVIAQFDKRDPAVVVSKAIANDAPGSSASAKVKPKGSSYSQESDQSEWGGVAIFRGDFAKPPCHCVFDFHSAQPRFELRLSGKNVISGPWTVETRIGGELLEEPDGWSVVCWFSDEEADYIELLAELPSGIRLTRHVIYANDDDLLILAASVQNAGDATIETTVTLPVTNGKCSRDKENRLVHIKGGDPVRVIPLGLAQDPFDGTAGRIELGNGDAGETIVVEQANSADGLCVPIAFDLNAKGKYRRPLDWRRLTVAENGRVLPRGRADAWRLRIGAHDDSPQWLYYQSLEIPQFNRSVLGLHTPFEMVFGRFEDGEVDSLVHVESE